MKSELEIFREYIRQRGLRRTPEREEILQQIFETHEHFDVDGLYLRLKQKGAKVSKASIYRALRLFLDCGLIREVDFSDGHWHYEYIYGHGPHCHLRCLSCGQIVEFEEPGLPLLQERLARQYGYRIADLQLEVKGYCSPCQAEQQDD
ncbi:MAG: transcriptional repressor [Deltaproteobacteria bacterium]|nr:transcriptional repressor [Deltaproteobacteria bacterium]